MRAIFGRASLPAAMVILMSIMLPAFSSHAAAAAPASAQARTTSAPSLYERLGGYDGVASFIALVFPRVAQHPDLAHLFRGHGKDSQQRQFQLVVELICQKTGGPCRYIGRPMAPVHDGLAITEAHWTAFMKIIGDGITEKKYSDDVRNDFLAMWRAFHDEVVRP